MWILVPVWRLIARGNWTLPGGLPAIDEALRTFARRAMGQELVIDMADISRLDTAGAMALQRTMFDCAQRAGRLTQIDHYKGGSIEHMALIDQAAKHLESCQVGPKRGNAFIIMLNRIGLGASNVRKQSLSVLGFVGAVMERIGVIVTHPKRLRTTSIVFHMEESGLNASLIVGLMSFLIGAVVAFMGATVLRQFGAQIYTVELIGITVLREFGVLLTAILIAGRSGSAYTAQIGSMKLREEVDAMEAMGIDPLEALVIPRTIALVVVMPVLAFLAAMMGLLGGGLVTWLSMDISPVLFLTRMQETVLVTHFMVGIVKAPFFAFVIAIIGCYHGMSVRGSAEELGRHTIMSVVQSLFLVILIDAMFAILFLELDI